jgi:uncharacterized protein YpmB
VKTYLQLIIIIIIIIRLGRVVVYLPESNEVSAEAEESPLLEAVTKERLVKTQQIEKALSLVVG